MYSYVLKADTKTEFLFIECNWYVNQCQKVEKGDVIAGIDNKSINAEQGGYVWLNKLSLNINKATTKYVSRKDNLVFEVYDTWEDLKLFHPDSDKYYLDFYKNKNYFKKDETLACIRKDGKELLIKAEEDGYYVTDFESIKANYDEAPNIVYVRYDSKLGYITREPINEIQPEKDAFTGKLSLSMRKAFNKLEFKNNLTSLSESLHNCLFCLDISREYRIFLVSAPYIINSSKRASFINFEIQDSECLISFIHPKREYNLNSATL